MKVSEEVLRLPERDAPISESLAGDLIVMYAFDLPGRFAFVAQRHCEEFGLDAGDLRALSVRNLRTRRRKPQVIHTDACLMFTSDGDLEASPLLIDIVWKPLARRSLVT